MPTPMAAMSLGEALKSTAHLQPKPAPSVRSARSRNRASAWAYDLAKWREYRIAIARTERERSDIEVEYAARLEAGPDFTRHHGGSEFGEAPLNHLDKAGRSKILAAFDQVREWIWKNARRRHGQGVSQNYRSVLAVVLSFAVKYGRAFPSYATIARLACVSERTVANALAWLKLWGFLSWQRRLKRVDTRLGRVVQQASNGYRASLTGLARLGAAVFSGADRNQCDPSGFTHQARKLFAQALQAGAASPPSVSL